jgi:hypothetical protein
LSDTGVGIDGTWCHRRVHAGPAIGVVVRRSTSNSTAPCWSGIRNRSPVVPVKGLPSNGVMSAWSSYPDALGGPDGDLPGGGLPS